MRSVMHPSLPKKHYKIRRFLSFLLSQAPLSKPGPHPGLAPRQGWEPIGSNFHRSVPIYSKRNHSQNHHKVRDQYIEKKKIRISIYWDPIFGKNKNEYNGTMFCNFSGGRDHTLGRK